MRTNLAQERAAEIFEVSQATVSRRWDLIRPAIGVALAPCIPRPDQVVGQGTVLVDGTIAPTWNWKAIPNLHSGKAGYPGINIQVAATLGGDLAAIGAIPVPRARHDAHAFAASGLKHQIAGHDAAADLGYTGVDTPAPTTSRSALPSADRNTPGTPAIPNWARSPDFRSTTWSTSPPGAITGSRAVLRWPIPAGGRLVR
jgi:hypothetical protein